MTAYPMSNERIRVQCGRCGAHRDKTIAPSCLVCGAVTYSVVAPTAGDLDAITREVVEAAELVDVAIHEADGLGVDRAHPAARRLQAACRNLALARAGCVGMGSR